MGEAGWRDDLDALQFPVPGHGGLCLIHRLAFRALVADAPSREACLAFFHRKAAAFLTAARQKIERQAIPPGRNLHLNSRDIRRAMTGADGGPQGRACRVLGG